MAAEQDNSRAEESQVLDHDEQGDGNDNSGGQRQMLRDEIKNESVPGD